MSRSEDEDQLKLLSIFHYVVGGLSGLFALFPILHLIVGLVIVFSPEALPGKPGEGPPAVIGWFFAGIAACAIVTGLVMATCIVIAGRSLARRTRYTYCLVIAGIECMFMPFGTVLGVFTLIVLQRESVKELFQPHSEADVSPDEP